MFFPTVSSLCIILPLFFIQSFAQDAEIQCFCDRMLSSECSGSYALETCNNGCLSIFTTDLHNLDACPVDKCTCVDPFTVERIFEIGNFAFDSSQNSYDACNNAIDSLASGISCDSITNNYYTSEVSIDFSGPAHSLRQMLIAIENQGGLSLTSGDFLNLSVLKIRRQLGGSQGTVSNTTVPARHCYAVRIDHYDCPYVNNLPGIYRPVGEDDSVEMYYKTTLGTKTHFLFRNETNSNWVFTESEYDKVAWLRHDRMLYDLDMPFNWSINTCNMSDYITIEISESDCDNPGYCECAPGFCSDGTWPCLHATELICIESEICEWTNITDQPSLSPSVPPPSRAPSTSLPTRTPSTTPTATTSYPIPVSAEFSSDGLEITVVFDKATDQGDLTENTFDCALIMTPVVDSICAWVNPTRFTIFLSSNHNAEIGMAISILESANIQSMNRNSEGSARGDVIISQPSNGWQNPKAIITGNTRVTACTGLELSAELSHGNLGKPFTYVWIQKYSDVVFPASTTSTYKMDRGDLTSVSQYVSEFTIELIVTNWVNQSDSEEVIIVILTDESAPSISIHGAASQEFVHDESIELRISVDACGQNSDDDERIHYEWEVIGRSRDSCHQFQLITTKDLMLPASTLSPDCDYTVRVTASIGNAFNYATVELAIRRREPDARGVFLLTHPFEESLSIEADDLFSIPEIQNKSYYDYDWTCESECDCTFTTKHQDSEMFFDQNAFEVDCTYSITIRMTNDYIEVENTCTVITFQPEEEVTYLNVHITSDFAGPMGVRERRRFSATTESNYHGDWSWTVNGTDAPYFTSGNNLILDARDSPLTPSSNIILSVSPEQDDYRGQASIQLDVDAPPRDGTCSVPRETYHAYDSITITCTGWIDESTILHYRFILIDDTFGELTLSRSSQQNTFTYDEAPAGQYRIRVEILDEIGQYASTNVEIESFGFSVDENVGCDEDCVEIRDETVLNNLDVAVDNVELDSFARGVLSLKNSEETSTQRSIISKMKNLHSNLTVVSLENTLQQAQTLSVLFPNQRKVEESLVSDVLTLGRKYLEDSVDLTVDESQSVSTPLLDTIFTLKAGLSNVSDTFSECEDFIADTLLLTMNGTVPGESFSHSKNGTSAAIVRFGGSTSARRRLVSYSTISGDTSTIEMPIADNDDNEYDCVVIEYPSTDALAADSKNPVVTVDLYEASSATPVDVQDQDACEPIVILVPLSAPTENGKIPSCQWYDFVEQTYKGDGCILSSFTNETATCSCTHLTTFTAFVESFDPNVQIISHENIKDVSLDNILSYPVPLLCCLSLVITGLIMCEMLPNRRGSTRPILAVNQVLPKGNDRLNVLMESEFGQSMAIRNHQEYSSCTKLKEMFYLRMRNHHSLVAILARANGTNHSTRERILCFIMFIFINMACSGLFYSGDYHHKSSELLWLSIIAAISTGAVYVLRKIFRLSRPSSFRPEELIVEELTRIMLHKTPKAKSPTPGFYNVAKEHARSSIELSEMSQSDLAVSVHGYSQSMTPITSTRAEGEQTFLACSPSTTPVNGSTYAKSFFPNSASLVTKPSMGAIPENMSGFRPESPITNAAKKLQEHKIVWKSMGSVLKKSQNVKVPHFMMDHSSTTNDSSGPHFLPHGPTPAMFETPSPVVLASTSNISPTPNKRRPSESKSKVGQMSPVAKALPRASGIQLWEAERFPPPMTLADYMSQHLNENSRRESNDSLSSSSSDLMSIIRSDLKETYLNMVDQDSLNDFIQKEDNMEEGWDIHIDEYRAFLILRRHLLIRKALLRMYYPFSRRCKVFAWLIGVCVILISGFAVLFYGIQFEKTYQGSIDPSLESAYNQCGPSVSYETLASYQASEEELTHWSQELPLLPSWSFPDSWGTVTRWLVMNIIGVLQSVLIFEPCILLLIAGVILFILPLFTSASENSKESDEEIPSRKRSPSGRAAAGKMWEFFQRGDISAPHLIQLASAILSESNLQSNHEAFSPSYTDTQDLSFSPTRTTILTSQGFDDYSGCYSLIEMPSVRSYQPGDSQIVGTLPMVDYSEDMLSSKTVES